MAYILSQNIKNKGSISHAMAIQKAESEYDKYKIIQKLRYLLPCYFA